MRKCILGLVLGLALLLPRAGTASDWFERGDDNDVQPSPEPPRAFWYGGDMPLAYTAQTPNGPVALPVGQAVNDFLTKPNPITKVPSPLTLLSAWMMAYDNTKGQAGLTKPDVHRRAFRGYTLLTVLNGYKVPGDDTVYNATLIDMDGNIVKKWPLFGFPVKMLPNGNLLGGNGPGLPQHQEQGALVQIDWCGNVVWDWYGPDPGNAPANGGARQHHDFQREGSPTGYYAPGLSAKASGKTLVLAHENPPRSLTMGVSNVMDTEEDVIYEIGEAGNVLWAWHPYEHIDAMGFSPIAREAIRTIPVGAPADIGGGFVQTDWQHINSASYLGPNKWYELGDRRFHPDNIIWDGRSSNVIAIVARHDDPAGKWKSGDIVWRMGPEYGPGTPEHEVGQIIGQHHAHLIPHGLPGAGNLLVFDNGGLAGFGNLFPGLPAAWPVAFRTYSRVLEINPITFHVVWEYTNKQDTGEGRQFFSWYISSAQRLPNGNTLITEGANGRLFEVTRKGDLVWEYIWPKSMSAGSGTGFGNAVYRAYRVPPQWIPRNTRCP